MEHPAYCIFKLENMLSLGLWFWVVNTYPKSMCKTLLFRKNMALRKRRNDTASFVEQPVYSEFKVENSLIVFVDFDLPLPT